MIFLFGHCGCVAASTFRFLAEKRGIGRNRGVRQRLTHVDLTLGLHGAIQPFAERRHALLHRYKFITAQFARDLYGAFRCQGPFSRGCAIIR